MSYIINKLENKYITNGKIRIYKYIHEEKYFFEL